MQYFKEYLYNVKLNKLLIGGENKLENSINKVDKYLLDIYREFNEEPKEVLKNYKIKDILDFKEIIVDDDIIYEQKYDKNIKILNQITDYFIYPSRMKCLIQGEEQSSYDIFIDELSKNKDLNYQQKKEVLYKMKKHLNCSLLHFQRLIHILKKMMNNKKDIKYLDCSSGWGDRMIASLLLGISEYVGYDPNINLEGGHSEIINYFKDDLFSYYGSKESKFVNYKVIYKPFEYDYYEEKNYENYFDICVSSPPFFRVEIYSITNEQSINSYRSMDSWLYNFLIPSFKKIMKLLRTSGYLCWYIEDRPEYKYLDTLFDEINKLGICKYINKIGYKYDDNNTVRYFYIWQKNDYKQSRITPISSPSYYIKTKYDNFDTEMSKQLKERGYKLSSDFPVDFIFLSDKYAYYKNKFDTKKSTYISILKGKSKEEITNKILLNRKFKNSDFIINSIYLTSNQKISEIDESLKILKPKEGFEGKGIKIVNTKNEIIEWMKKNNEYSEWILEDYILNPDLKDGYKFHFRVWVLVKVVQYKKPEVFINNYKYFILAHEKYKKSDYLNKNIHDTHDKPLNELTFPNDLPDNWTKNDVIKIDSKINNIIKEIFDKQLDFYPEWDAMNGFEIFGADFIFENKHPYLLEINKKMDLEGRVSAITGILETVLDNKKNKYFTQLI